MRCAAWICDWRGEDGGRMRARVAWIALLTLLCGAAVGQGTDGIRVYYVAPGGTASGVSPVFATPQEAIDAVDDAGDLIKVAAGTYSTLNTAGGLSQIAMISKSVTIRGGFTASDWQSYDQEANVVTLDAGRGGRGLFISGDGIRVTLEGLAVTGGSAVGLGGDGVKNNGGGLFIVDTNPNDWRTPNTLNLKDCHFYDNTAGDTHGSGGGIYDAYTATVNLTNCIIEDNVATDSGNGQGGGAALNNGTKTLSGNTIRNNRAGDTAGYSHGGGVYTWHAELTLEENVIAGNQAGGDGGGACFEHIGDFPHSVVLTDNVFDSNAAGRYGGGLALLNSHQQPGLTMEHNDIRGNTSGSLGGGMYLYKSDLVLNGNQVRGNEASGYGGGMWLGLCFGNIDNTIASDNTTAFDGAGLNLWRGAPTFRHTTFANNGGDSTACIRAEDSGVVFENSILSGSNVGVNTVWSISSTSTTLVNTLWEGATTRFVEPARVGDIGSFDGVAAFADAGNADVYLRDYHILADSDAIDAASVSDLVSDWDYQVRPMGAYSDLGADEYGDANADVSLTLARQGAGIANAGARILLDAVLANAASSDPAGGVVSFTATPATALSEISATSDSGTCSVFENTARCTLLGIPGGEERSITLAVTPKASYEGQITIEGNVRPLGATDSEAANNTAEPVQVHVEQGPAFTDVWVLATGPAFALPGQEITYDVLCRNGGSLAAENAVLSATLASELSFVRATGSPEVSGRVIRWDLASLAAGTAVPRSVTATAGAGLAHGSIVTTSAAITTDSATDPEADNSVSVTTTVFAGDAAMTLEKTASEGRWAVVPDPVSGEINGLLVQEYLLGFQYLSSESPAPRVTSFTITDEFPALLDYVRGVATVPLSFSQDGHSLTFGSSEALYAGEWGWLRVGGTSATPQAGASMLNTAELAYELETGHTDSASDSANSVVPLMPPIITFPEWGYVAHNEARELEVEGVAQANVTVRVYEDEILKAEVLSDDEGNWEAAFETGLNPEYSVTVVAKAAHMGEESEESCPVFVRESRGWCPQRSYWEGTLKAGPSIGKFVRLRFRGTDGTFMTPPRINGIYGFWDTVMQLYTLCAPAKCIADGTEYHEEAPSPGDGRWRTINITGPAHEFELSFQCGGDPGTGVHTSSGVVLIDPDGYVFDVTHGMDTVLEGATATCMWYNEQWGGWVPWPAHKYEEQLNPQITEADGYFAFFTPPGFYYIDVTDADGFQPWRSPVVQVISEIVHVNVPASPSRSSAPHRVLVSLGGLSEETTTIPAGDTVEWVSACREGTSGAQVLALTADPVVHVRSALDPEADTDGFDSGMLPPGQTYRRRFTAEGSFAYTTGTGHTGTVVVLEAAGEGAGEEGEADGESAPEGGSAGDGEPTDDGEAGPEGESPSEGGAEGEAEGPVEAETAEEGEAAVDGEPLPEGEPSADGEAVGDGEAPVEEAEPAAGEPGSEGEAPVDGEPNEGAAPEGEEEGEDEPGGCTCFGSDGEEKGLRGYLGDLLLAGIGLIVLLGSARSGARQLSA